MALGIGGAGPSSDVCVDVLEHELAVDEEVLRQERPVFQKENTRRYCINI